MSKKQIIWMLVVAVLFSGVSIAELDDTGRLIVPETSVAPVIDGELDDVWQNVSEEGILITDIINAGGNVPPDDDSDLSGTFKVMYDNDNFYIYLTIQDSVIDYQFSNWNGDGVEIYFDGDNSKWGAYDGVNDNQIRITVDDVELANVDSSLPIDGSDFMVVITDLGYNIEASFPLEKLQIIPETTFGFEVQINDNDGGGGRETMTRWFSNDNNSWQDSSLFGEAVLVPAPEPVDPGIDGLIAFYAMDGDPNDSSGNGNDGILFGDLLGWVEGKVGGALSHGGLSDAGVEIPTTGMSATAGTVAMWGLLSDPQPAQTKYFFGHTTQPQWSNRVQLYMNDGDNLLDLGLGDNHNRQNDIVDLPMEEWLHVALTWDSNDYVVYLNGESVATGTYAGFTDVNEVANIGNDGSREPYEAFAGILDEVVIYSRALSAGEILYLVGYPTMPVDPGSDGLVASYEFENNADDSSANGLNGTLVGDPVFVEGMAGYGMALDLDGIDDVVELGKLDVIGQVTLAAWINADDFEINDARIITKAREWGGNDHWWMLSTISETSLRFRLKTDDGQDTSTLISDPALEVGVWAHVAVTWDGAMMRIYKDGVEVASQEKGGSAVAVDPDISAAIGSQPSDAFASDPGHVAKFFDGLIDEAKIYERALSGVEILYLAGF